VKTQCDVRLRAGAGGVYLRGASRIFRLHGQNSSNACIFGGAQKEGRALAGLNGAWRWRSAETIRERVWRVAAGDRSASVWRVSARERGARRRKKISSLRGAACGSRYVADDIKCGVAWLGVRGGGHGAALGDGGVFYLRRLASFFFCCTLTKKKKKKKKKKAQRCSTNIARRAAPPWDARVRWLASVESRWRCARQDGDMGIASKPAASRGIA